MMRYHFAWTLPDAAQRQVERLARRYSLEVTEVLEMIAECAEADFRIEHDPAPGQGERFAFAERRTLIDADAIASANVPPPDANVSLMRAFDVSMNDALVVKYLLDTRPALDVLFACSRNQTAWWRFWSRRDPDPEKREWFRSLADLHEIEMQRMLAKAQRKGLVGSGERQWSN